MPLINKSTFKNFWYVLSFIVMWFLSVMRQEYIYFLSESLKNDWTEDIGDFVFNFGINYLHLIANLAIFVVAFIASFYHHNKKIN